MNEQNTIGKMIGIVTHTFSITNDQNDKVQLKINMDFNTATDQDIISWAVSNRTISGQRPWKKLTRQELLDLDSQTFIAQDIGKKIKGLEERIQILMNAGLSKNLATQAINNPESFRQKAEELEETID